MIGFLNAISILLIISFIAVFIIWLVKLIIAYKKREYMPLKYALILLAISFVNIIIRIIVDELENVDLMNAFEQLIKMGIK